MTDLLSPEASADSRPTRDPDLDGPPSATVAPSERTITIPNLPYRRLLGFALMGLTGLIVLFLVYLLAFTPLTAARNQQRLSDSLKGQPLTVYKLVDGRIPPEGSAVAVLEIPSIGVNKVVVSGTSAADLMTGPGLMSGSALPGTVGNSVIAARKVTFGGPFGAIGSLPRGARIRVVDGAGTFVYRVTGVHSVTIGQKDVVVPTADNRLTLVTSDSSFVTGGRQVVVAKLIGTAVVVPGAATSVPGFNLGLGGDAAAGGLAILWSILTIVTLVGAAYVVWRTRKTWLVYLFAAPVVLMFGLFACQAVARALPATY